MSRWGLSASVLLALAVVGCQATPPDGVFACRDSSDCPSTQRCYEGICRVEPRSTGEANSSDQMSRDAASSAPEPQSVSQPDNPSTDGGAAQSGKAGMHSAAAGESGTPAAGGGAGNAGAAIAGNAGNAAADGGPTPSCACSTTDACCDGCQPKNENGSCGAAQSCAKQICRAGTCTREVAAGFCLINGFVCYQDGQEVNGNACSYCDASLSTSSLSFRAFGANCDDHVFCNGPDTCDDSGGCTGHQGSSCSTGNGCPACNEVEKVCFAASWTDSATALEWLTRPEGPRATWGDARSTCNSLTMCDQSDWRVPTIAELRTLIRGCASTQVGGSCGVSDACSMSSCAEACTACAATSARVYWPDALGPTALTHWSSYAVTGDEGNAWAVDFATGAVVSRIESSTLDVRCVRDTR